jgi:hypothetical protein
VHTVRSVGAHRRRLRGRPRMGRAKGRVLVRRAPLSRVCERLGGRVDGVALTGRRLPVPIGNAGLDGIRRTQPPCRRPAPHGATSPRHWGSRNPHSVRRHRPACGHARADFTSPCTAGQRANIPGIYLCLRGGPGPGWAARRGARLVAGPFPRGLPPEPRWRLSTHVALWDLRRAVGGCPWIAS